MKNFLDKLQTPAEIRREEQKKREKENHPDESSKDIPENDCEQEEKEEEVEVVANLNEARIEFGNGCFMRFEEATLDNNANDDDDMAASEGEKDMKSNGEDLDAEERTPLEQNHAVNVNTDDIELNVTEDTNTRKKKEKKRSVF